jgi:hypothetical protein
LFIPELAESLELTADESLSHYGFPPEQKDYFGFITQLPNQDLNKIFGFTNFQENENEKFIMFRLLD